MKELECSNHRRSSETFFIVFLMKEKLSHLSEHHAFLINRFLRAVNLGCGWRWKKSNSFWFGLCVVSVISLLNGQFDIRLVISQDCASSQVRWKWVTFTALFSNWLIKRTDSRKEAKQTNGYDESFPSLSLCILLVATRTLGPNLNWKQESSWSVFVFLVAGWFLGLNDRRIVLFGLRKSKVSLWEKRRQQMTWQAMHESFVSPLNKNWTSVRYFQTRKRTVTGLL